MSQGPKKRGEFAIGDTVEWVNFDRRGSRKFSGVVTGECPRRNTHIRVKTDAGTRYVHRCHAHHTILPPPHPESVE